MLNPTYQIPSLPPEFDFESKQILQALANANRHLAEVKGRATSIPNQTLLIDTLSLQEAKASSEIENIVTTHDELFKRDLFPEGPSSGPAKEVTFYREALKVGFQRLIHANGLLTNNTLIEMFRILKNRNDGFRVLPGTALLNETTSKTVYVPPQSAENIHDAMSALEEFINEGNDSGIDPLIKMTIIHHQFESIHPFPDGNGRIGRILNVLYLTKVGLLEIPILYLSREINKTKSEYYRLLQLVRDTGEWEEWVVYMLNAVAKTSVMTLTLIDGIRAQMADYKVRIRSDLPKTYSQDLINNIFRHPYTRIEYLQSDLGVSRQTAAKHLDLLAKNGFLIKHQSGKNNYYINSALVDLLLKVSE